MVERFFFWGGEVGLFLLLDEAIVHLECVFKVIFDGFYHGKSHLNENTIWVDVFGICFPRIKQKSIQVADRRLKSCMTLD